MSTETRRLLDNVRNLLNGAAGGARHNPITLPRISLQQRDDNDVAPVRRVTLWPAGHNEDGD